jgi:hypothetical protein
MGVALLGVGWWNQAAQFDPDFCRSRRSLLLPDLETGNASDAVAITAVVVLACQSYQAERILAKHQTDSLRMAQAGAPG